jgi:hypothetical protein
MDALRDKRPPAHGGGCGECVRVIRELIAAQVELDRMRRVADAPILTISSDRWNAAVLAAQMLPGVR